MSKKVFIQTFGCQMNVADSQEMLTHLQARGALATDDLEQADIVLINTCTVREHAEHRAISFLGRLAKWKEKRPGRHIIFAGCAAQRLGKALKKDFPFLDLISGAKEIEAFSDALDASGLFSPTHPHETTAEGGIIGYVTIMRGCDFACSYCIVPSVRGKVKCLSPEHILSEIKEKTAKGVKEIVLLGQTVNAYRFDETDFGALLNQAANVPGVERVRFMSPHPAFITPQFMQTVRENPKIAKYIHLPIQSGSTRVLKEMQRGYTRETLLEKIKMLTENGFSVSTDIIVGFPTETEDDFRQTLSLVDEAGFTAAYCFKFSPRAGTPAANLPELDQKILEERLDILLNKVRGLTIKAYQQQVGTRQTILMESEQKGRTSNNFWARTQKIYTIGDTVEAEIVSSDGTLLFTRD